MKRSFKKLSLIGLTIVRMLNVWIIIICFFVIIFFVYCIFGGPATDFAGNPIRPEILPLLRAIDNVSLLLQIGGLLFFSLIVVFTGYTFLALGNDIDKLKNELSKK